MTALVLALALCAAACCPTSLAIIERVERSETTPAEFQPHGASAVGARP